MPVSAATAEIETEIARSHHAPRSGADFVGKDLLLVRQALSQLS
jgi:hypothetical protein